MKNATEAWLESGLGLGLGAPRRGIFLTSHSMFDTTTVIMCDCCTEGGFDRFWGGDLGLVLALGLGLGHIAKIGLGHVRARVRPYS